MSSDNPRRPEAEVHPQFVERWSPRAFDPSDLTDDQVRSLFEAARWAPSCFNEQPWLFVYCRSAEDRARMEQVLVPGNWTWAHKAPVLGVVFGRKDFTRNDKPNRWSAYDAGAAGMSLALQAHAMGLVTHFMGGFDAELAHEVLGVPADTFEALAAFAVGKQGDKADLPSELAEREAPSSRKPLAEVAHEARYTGGKS